MPIDLLEALLGSAARAAVIAALFGDDTFGRSQSEIAREAGLPRATVARELQRLVAAGVVERGRAMGLTQKKTESDPAYGRPFLPARACPIYQDLRTLAMRTRGAAAVIRGALPELARLAWISGSYALGLARREDPLDVVVIGHPKQLIARKLTALEARVTRRIKPVVIHHDEWVARLDKREVTVLRLRRRPKLWLRGDAVALYRLERHQRETKDLIQRVMATGLDLTDDWDEDWDPFQVFDVPLGR